MENKIHFIGIGGVSMSALAQLCLNFGVSVSGVDDCESATLQKLRELGAKIVIGSDKKSIEQSDLVVYTIAVKNHKDLIFAQSLNKKIMERAQFLGKISSKYKNVIAVAGTHGKTTTTAMLGNIFKVAGLEPTVHLGGFSQDLGGNLLIGKTDYFITEACEYNRSFLSLRPNYSIITNIEEDHLDCYKNLDEIKSAFLDFADLTSKKVIICGDNIDKNEFADEKFLRYGLLDSNQLFAKNIKESKAKYSFDCIYNGKKLFRINNNILGKHNILNALACIALSLQLGISPNDIKSGIENFSGVDRRQTFLGKINEVQHYQDYAHHPTEIKTLLATLKLIKKGRIIAIFQPHTYTRTFGLMKEFVTCFDDADFLYLLPTYSARENYLVGGDTTDLFYNLGGRIDCQYCSNFNSLSYELKKNLRAKDICVWIGAGDIDQIAKTFIHTIKPPK